MAIDVYGVTRCGGCKQTKSTLEELDTEYTWHNTETEGGVADRVVAISDQQHIPAVLYSDGTFQVELSAVDIENKLSELSIK